MTTREVVWALYGAWRLARLDRAGMGFFDTSAAGAWRSFAVGWFTVPATVAASYIEWQLAGDADRHATGELALSAVLHVVRWLGFLAIVDVIARMTGRNGRFASFVVIYNWVLVVKLALLLGLSLAALAGFGSTGLLTLVTIVVIALFIAYQTFAFGHALMLPAAPAFGLVLIELLLSRLIQALANLPTPL